MKVFIVEGGWNFLCSQIWDIYSSREGAEAGILKARSACQQYDWTRITERDVL